VTLLPDHGQNRTLTFKSVRHAQRFLAIHNSSAVIASAPSSIARLAMPPFARGAVSPKLRLQRKIQRCRFGPSPSATGNLTMPLSLLPSKP